MRKVNRLLLSYNSYQPHPPPFPLANAIRGKSYGKARFKLHLINLKCEFGDGPKIDCYNGLMGTVKN